MISEKHKFHLNPSLHRNDSIRLDNDYNDTLTLFKTERLKQTNVITNLKQELNQLEAKTKAIMSTTNKPSTTHLHKFAIDKKAFPNDYIFPANNTERGYLRLEEELMQAKKLLKEKEWALNNQIQINRKLKEEIESLQNIQANNKDQHALKQLLQFVYARLGGEIITSVPETQIETLLKKAQEMIFWTAEEMKGLNKKYEILLDKYNKVVYNNKNNEFSFTHTKSIPNDHTQFNINAIRESRLEIQNRNSDLYYDLNLAEYSRNEAEDVRAKINTLNTKLKVIENSSLGITIQNL